MKTLIATAAAVLGLYGLFLLMSTIGRLDDAPLPGAAATAGAENDPRHEEPQYGGILNVGTWAITLSALSWDPADWNWKQNHDTGMYFEQLFAADLDKSVRKGGAFPFTMQAYLPAGSIRGELAENGSDELEWEDPLTVVVHLRKGVMFPDKPGVMERRELTADDVVFSFERQRLSPKIIPTYFDHIDKVIARDEHTVVFRFKEYNAEWDYRFGYGYYSGILPRELGLPGEPGAVDVKDWRNAVGSGPFQVERFIDGNSQIYVRTPDYWDRETLNGRQYEIPFIDKLVYRTIKDESTWLTALRTGKLDILEAIRWLAVDHLKKTTPELRWSRWLSTNGVFLSMRVDKKPFDDVRVRRAMNLAVNQPEIVELFYGGHAELFAYPQKPDFVGYFEPLENMPPSVQELFTFNPEKAKRLLAEAGYPDGFTFTTQVSATNPDHLDLIPLIVDYLSDVGVTMKIQTMEYAAHLSAMTTRNHEKGYLVSSGHVNPTTTLRKSFLSGQTWNIAMFSDPDVDARILEMLRTRDEAKRQEIARGLTTEMLDRAPYLWLPTQYVYSAWWPWVKNYNGELRAGAQRPGPIYARLWIDRKMKKEMGFD